MKPISSSSFTFLGVFEHFAPKWAFFCNKIFFALAKFCKKVLTNE